MAKHDRRKRSSQPRGSRTVSIQVPLPVLGVLNGVREAFHGFCITTGIQVLEAMMEGIEKTCAARRGAIRASGPRGAAGAWPVKWSCPIYAELRIDGATSNSQSGSTS